MFNKKRIEELEKELGIKECLLDKQKAVLEKQAKEIDNLRRELLKNSGFVKNGKLDFTPCFLKKENHLDRFCKKSLLKECLGSVVIIFDTFNGKPTELKTFNDWYNNLKREDFYKGLSYNNEVARELDEMRLSEIKDYFETEARAIYEVEKSKQIEWLNSVLNDALKKKVGK